MHSEYLSEGHDSMQACSSSPVQPHVHAAVGVVVVVVVGQGDSHVWMHSAYLSEGHAEMHALRSSPSHPQVQVEGDGGVGVGGGGGVGVGGIGGVGLGVDTEPLVTSGSDLRDAMEDLSQHS
jgi:hypothetical protein